MGLTCLVINYKFDKRYSDSDQIVSHAGDSIDAFSIEHLYDLYPIVIDSSYVPNPQLVNDISLPKWDDIDVILIIMKDNSFLICINGVLVLSINIRKLFILQH